jgi:hypothetical protein
VPSRLGLADRRIAESAIQEGGQVPEAWANRYCGLLAKITGGSAMGYGYPPDAVEAAEARLGVRLPGPLRDYYLSVGKHPINYVHNRLWSPDALEIAQRRLVFMEENQNVVFWGVRSRTSAVNPMVFQTTELEDGDWFAEARCSEFLAAMMCWQAVMGGLPHLGQSGLVALAAARRLTRGWSLAGRIHEMSAFVTDGRVLFVIKQVESAILYLGSHSREDFQALASKLGIDVNEA